MIEITKSIEWNMGHRVPFHKNKCRSPHGHRYKLELTLGGDISQEKGTSQEGMLYDFGDIKRILSEKIYKVVDHAFMACKDDELMAPLALGPGKDLNFILVPFIPTVENIVAWCYQLLQDAFPPTLKIVRLRLFETPTSWADFYPQKLFIEQQG